ncbi:hypothetical protein ACFLTU_08190, partial [Bacteroidota bacterium]
MDSAINYTNIPVQTGPAPFFRKYIEQSHQFTIPLNGDCEYVVRILFYYESTAIPSATQIQYVGNWHVDNEADGVIAITPPIEEVCEGEDVVDFTFQDASTFACVDIGLNNPNSIERNVQFVYNTNHTVGQGIPNLSINVYGEKVDLTDAFGEPVANSWTVDPTDGSIVPAYSTISGYFEGPVISTGFSPTGGSQQTFPISFPGAGTVANDYFEVTVRNWNYCNQWNGDQYPANPSNWAVSKTSTARILIIDAPDAPTISDDVICYGTTPSLTVGSAPVGIFRWYKDAAKTILLDTATNTYTFNIPGPVASPTDSTVYVADGALSGNFCEGPATEVTLTINPIPAIPTISITPPGVTPKCFDTNPVELTASGDGNTDSWQWYRNTVQMGGETGNTITVGPAVSNDNYTVRAVGIATTLCTDNPSLPQNVTINAQPSVNVGPALTAICQGGTTAALGGSFGGGATAAVWSDGGAGGSFANNTGATPGTATYTAAAGAPVSVTLTLTTSGGSCGITSDTKNLTVNPNPTVDVGPAMAAICQGGTTAALGGSFGGGATAAVWSDGGAGGSFANNGGATPNTATYTAAAGAPASVTLTLTTSGGSCGTTNDSKVLTVNPNPTVNVGAATPAICQGGTTIGLGGSFGGGATAAVWDDGGAGGSFTNNGGATPNTATYTATPGAPASVTLTLTTSGGSCGTTNDSKALTVNPNPTANAGGAIPAICQSGTTIALGGSFGGGATSAVWSDGGAGGSFTNNGGATPNTATYTASAASPASVTLTLTTSGGSCGAAVDTKVLTVNPNPTVSVGAATPAICQSGTTIGLGGLYGGGATSAVWDDGGAGGSFANNGGATPGIATYTAAAGAPASVTLTLTTSGGSCGTINDSKILNVNPNPTVNVGGAIPAICQSGTTIALGGSFGGGATSAVWDDGGAGGSFANNGGATPNTTIYTAAAGVPASVTLTLTTSGGSCGPISDTKNLTVNPNPTVNVGAATPAICQGGTTIGLGGAFGGGATAAVWSDGGAGGSFSNNAGATPNTATYTAAAGAPALVTLTLTTSGGLCGTTFDTKNLTVNPNPTVNIGPAIPDICQSSTTIALGGSFGGGATSAVWDDGGAGGSFADNGGATPNTATYTASGTSPALVTLTLTTGGGSCGTVNDSKTLTVTPKPIPSVSGDNDVCSGEVGVLYTTAPVGGNSYDWDISGGVITLGEFTNQITVTWGGAGAGWVRVEETHANGCVITTSNYDVNINPLPPVAAGAITGAANVCYEETGVPYSITPVLNATNYVWTVPGGTIATGSGSTSITVNFTPGAPDFTIEVYPENGCGQGLPAATRPVAIYPDLTIGTITGSTSPICYGADEGTLTANPSGGDGSYAYEWFKNGVTTSINTQNYAAGNLTANTDFYYEVTSCGQTKQSPIITINVHPDLVIGAITGSTSPICYNTDEGTLTANPSDGDGSYTYEWFKDGVSTGITTSTYAAGNLTANTDYYYRVTSCGQTKQSPTVTIVVHPDLTAGSITGSSSPVCYNANAGTYTANPSDGDGSYTYEWFKDGVTTGVTTQTYAAGNLTASANYYYRVTSCGQTKQSPTVTISVYPDLVIGTITGSSSPICYNEDEGTLTANPSDGDGSYTYEWFKDGVTTGVTTQTYAAGNLTANTNYYYRVTSCGQTKQSPPVNIVVTPDLVVGTITGFTSPICYNTDEGTLTANPSAGDGSYTYEWFKDGVTTGIITPTYAAGILTTSAGYYYRVTSCGQTKQSPTVNITVHPDLVVGSITGSSSPVCYGADAGTYTANPSDGDGTYTYEWFKDGVNTGVTTQTYPAGNLTANADYYYRVTSCGQTKQSSTINIIVNPDLVIGTITGSSSPICYNQDEGTLTANPSGGDGSYAYEWFKDGVTTGITTQTYAAGNLTASTDYYYRVTSCGQTKQSPAVSITVTPDLVIGIITGSTSPICYNQDEGTLTANPSGGDGSYAYEWFKDGVTTGVTTQTYPAGNLTANTDYYYRVTSCGQTKQSPTVTISVYPDLVIGTITGSSSPICYNADEGTLTANPSGGDGSYAYEWFKDGVTTGVTTQTYAAGNLTTNANYYYRVTSCLQTKQSPTVSIVVNPDLVIGAITGATSPICYNQDEGTLTANPSDGDGSYAYEWYKNGVTTGITTQTYAAGNLTANTDYYYRVTSCGQTKQSPTVTITVTPDLVIGAITGSTSPICYNQDEGTLTANPSGGDGSYAYEWFKDGITTGVTTQTYAAGSLTATTDYYYEVTSCGQTKQSLTVTITVYPDLVIGTISGSSSPICYNADAGTFTANPSAGDGSYTYDWFKDGVSTGITTPTYAAGNLTADANYYYRVTSCGQTKQSPTVTIVVNADLTIGTISGSTSPICYNADEGTLTANPSGGDGSFVYEWFKDGGSTGVTTSTYAAGNLTTNTDYYYSVTSCAQTKQSPTVSIVVHPDLVQGTITGVTSPICANEDEGTLTANPSGGDGTYVYEWFKDGVSTGVITQDYAAGNLTANTSFYYQVTSCTQTKQSPPVSVTVNPLPTTSDIIGDAQICNNATAKVYQVNNTSGSTYSWTVPGALVTKQFDAGIYFIVIDGIPGASGSGNIEVVETITATGCSGVTKTLPITVSPISPGVLVNGPTEVCNEDVGVTFSVPDNAGSTYSWTIPPGASYTSDPTLHEVTLSFGLALPAQTVSVVETVNGVCTTIHLPLTVDIHPLPTAYIFSGPSSYCTGNPGVMLSLGNSQNDVTYQLYKDGGAEGLPVAGSAGSSIDWSNLTVGIYNVVATDDITSCTEDMDGVITVVVTPAVVINPDPPATTDVSCNGGSDGTITVAATGGIPSFLYSAELDASRNFVSSNLFTGKAAGTYNIIVQDSKGCEATSTATVGQPSVLTASAAAVIYPAYNGEDISCFGESDGAVDVTTGGGAGGYTYQWYYDASKTSPVPGAEGQATPLENQPSGTYYVVVSDVNGCTAESNATLTDPPVLTLTPTSDVALSCFNDNSATGTFTAAGGTPDGGGAYTFVVTSNTAGATMGVATTNTIDFTGGSAGKVVVQVTDNNGCSEFDSILITEPPELVVTYVKSLSPEGSHNISCFNGNDGGVTVTVNGGVAPYTYAWSTADGGGIIAGAQNQSTLLAGTYTLTVTDANSCTWTDNAIDLTEPTQLTVGVVTDDAIISTCPTSVANLTATAAGGVNTGPGYSYGWTPTTGLTPISGATPVAKPPITTPYIVTATDDNGCTANNNITITVATTLSAFASVDDNIIGTCPSSVATVSLTVNGGEAGYTYSWVNTTTGLTDDILDVLGGVAGSGAALQNPVLKPTNSGLNTYEVTITDVNGCTTTTTVNVTLQPDVTAVASASDLIIGTCSSSTLSVVGGGGEEILGGGYTYAWLPAGELSNASAQSPVFTPATPNYTENFTVTITDRNGCTAVDVVSIDVTEDLTITSVTADDTIIGTCKPAQITSVITGGEEIGGGGYYYSWSPGTGLSNATIPNPVASPVNTTTYTLTVTDENGCTDQETITITVMPLLTVTSTPSDYSIGECNSANITTVVTGGEQDYLGEYQYSWTPSAGLSFDDIAEPVANPLVTTMYTLTVTDTNNCTAQSSFTITVVANLAATISASDLIIGDCNNSSLDVTVTGGEPSGGLYTYLWAPNDGTLTDINIKNPIATPTVLGDNVYTVTITDNNGCSINENVTINLRDVITAAATTSDDQIGTCAGSLATLDVNVTSGGEEVGGGGFYYSWDPTTGLNNASLKSPTAKPAANVTYTVTITDANGCLGTANVDVNVASPLTVSASAVDAIIGTCPGQSTVINTTVIGGEELVPATGYSYSWNPSASLDLTDPANPVASPATTTTYTVTVTDNNGCQASTNITVTVVTDLALSITADDVLIGTCVTSTSQITAIASGGEMPLGDYIYSWSPVAGLSNDLISNPVADLTVTGSYLYTLTVTDDNGCQEVETITIDVADPLAVVASVDDPIIGVCPTSVAYLDATVTGGEEFGFGGYSYSWSPTTGLDNPNKQQPRAKPAVTTDYTVTITDENGCQTTDLVTVTVADALAVTATTTDDIISSCPASTATLGVSIDTDSEIPGGGYTYSWSPIAGLSDGFGGPGENLENPVAKPAATTTYTVTVTDANGCQATSAITVTVAAPLNLSISADDYIVGDCNSSQITASVTGGEELIPGGDYTYAWDPGDAGLDLYNIANPVATIADTATFILTVTDENACTVIDSITIFYVDPITAVATASDSTIGTCSSATLNASVTAGGEGPYSYLWDNAGSLSNPALQSPVASPLVTTTYTVTITDANGCTGTANVEVVVTTDVSVSVVTSDDKIGTCASSEAQLSATASDGEELPGGGYTYNWTPSTGLDDATIANPVAKPFGTTTYRVTVTDRNGCTDFADIQVQVAPALSATASVADNRIGLCPTSTTTFDVTVIGGEEIG